MPSAHRKAALPLLMALALACNGLQAADFQQSMAKLATAPAQDKTQHQLQTALAGLGEGRFEASEPMLDEALAAIESVYSNAENAAKARSLWYEEGAKDYKGEPYERSMAYYYRGLMDMRQGDYENARASFRSGILQDAFAEEMQNRADFASLMLLEGWSNQVLGQPSQAREAYAEVSKLRPGWTAPAPDANTLVVVELGGAPRKVADGVGNSEIVYRPAKQSPERSALVSIDGLAVKPALMEDLLFQASTRGGRAIDRVIQGKVSFQSVTGKVGDVAANLASEAGLLSLAAGNSGGGNVLGGIAAVGAIASVVSANVKPRADVRFWNNLPSFLQIEAVKLDADPAQINVEFLDKDGKPVPGLQPAIHSWKDAKGRRVIWIRSRR